MDRFLIPYCKMQVYAITINLGTILFCLTLTAIEFFRTITTVWNSITNRTQRNTLSSVAAVMLIT